MAYKHRARPYPALRAYLMNDSMSIEDRRDFARRCGVAWGSIKNVMDGHSACGEGLAIAIDRESGGKVPVEYMRPDIDWAYLRGSGSCHPKLPSIAATRSGAEGSDGTATAGSDRAEVRFSPEIESAILGVAEIAEVTPETVIRVALAAQVGRWRGSPRRARKTAVKA